jgi:hypothetical protein
MNADIIVHLEVAANALLCDDCCSPTLDSSAILDKCNKWPGLKLGGVYRFFTLTSSFWNATLVRTLRMGLLFLS